MEATQLAATPAEELERQIMSPSVPKNEREHWAAREIERLRAKLSEKLAPDYFYNAEDWQVTTEWASRYEIDEDEVEVGQWREYATLIEGPKRFVARVPIAGDEDGELRWFETQEEAIAVLPPKKTI
jgi:hypothetical protein